MRTATFGAVGLILVGLVAAWRPTLPSPTPVPEPPDAAIQALVGPITERLAGHPDEARQLAAFYYAAAETIGRDGRRAKIVKTTSHLRTFCERAVTLRFQGAFAKVSGLAEAIHGPQGALSKMLGLEASELDHAQAAAALDAVAWACREAA